MFSQYVGYHHRVCVVIVIMLYTHTVCIAHALIFCRRKSLHFGEPVLEL